MQAKLERRLQAFRRTCAWGDQNPQWIPVQDGPSESWTPLTRQRAGLAAVIVRMEDAGSQQGFASVHTTLSATNDTALRTTLREELRAVSQVAKVLKKEYAGIGNLKMPSQKVSVEGLLNHASTFVKLATTYETVLVHHGMVGDFIAQIERAIAALKASLDGRGWARSARVGATKELALCSSQGHELVHLMDAALTKALRSDPAKLHEWKNATRVTRIGVAVPATAQSPFVVEEPDVAGTAQQQQQDSTAA